MAREESVQATKDRQRALSELRKATSDGTIEETKKIVIVEQRQQEADAKAEAEKHAKIIDDVDLRDSVPVEHDCDERAFTAPDCRE